MKKIRSLTQLEKGGGNSSPGKETMSQQQEIGKHRTTVRMENGELSVVFHNTEVVNANSDRIKLNTGGWFTPTTKTRMNQTANQFGLGFKVFQKDFDWFVRFNGRTHEFTGNAISLTK